jgi:hypothetical protein
MIVAEGDGASSFTMWECQCRRAQKGKAPGVPSAEEGPELGWARGSGAFGCGYRDLREPDVMVKVRMGCWHHGTVPQRGQEGYGFKAIAVQQLCHEPTRILHLACLTYDLLRVKATMGCNDVPLCKAAERRRIRTVI